MALLAGALLVLLACGAAPSSASHLNETRVTVFNVLCQVCTVEYGRWRDRLPALADSILRTAPHLVGVQEPLNDINVRQLLELMPGYDAVYCNGTFNGYFLNYPDAAILYDAAAFRPLETGWFWLSPTPDRPSLGWSRTGIPRIAVWARFVDLRSPGDRELYFLSTHFDPNSANHVPSANLLLERAAPWIARGLPVIATGDYNTEFGSDAYRILTEGNGGLAFNNTFNLAAQPRFDRNSTLPDEYGCVDYRPVFPDCLIDHILVAAPAGVAVTVTDWVVDIRQFTEASPYFPSDHRAYSASLVF